LAKKNQPSTTPINVISANFTGLRSPAAPPPKPRRIPPFEPGSIIKSFSFATAIDKGVITPSSTYNNTDCIKVADRTMCNALRGLDGTMTIQGAFNNSLNVGTITAIRKLGNGSQINLPARQTLYEYYHDKFGFGTTYWNPIAIIKLWRYKYVVYRGSARFSFPNFQIYVT
jgi:cell division protein FtsI/penicillin-binding protein 2